MGLDAWNPQDVGNYEVVILKNGFLELRSPLSSTPFQWFKEESGISTDLKWLYPYAVCEFPVTFMRLVKAIYSAVGIDSKIIVQQEYRNLSGFLLVGRHPLIHFLAELTNFNICTRDLTRLGGNGLLSQSLSQIKLLTIW